MSNNKYPTGHVVAVGKIAQLRFNEQGKADKQIPVLSMPEKVIADATTAKVVGKGKLCRIHGTSGGWVVFGDSTVGVPDGATQTALQTEAVAFLVVAPAEYIRTSAAMRIEVISD